MHVVYRGKQYEVAYPKFLGRFDLYGIKSRFSGGSIFPARKADCRPAKGGKASKAA